MDANGVGEGIGNEVGQSEAPEICWRDTRPSAPRCPLAACRLQMGFKGRTYNNNAQPVERFDAWLSERDSNQRPLWPGTLRLSDSFYNALMVYPDTKVKQVTGGLLLMASPPPPVPYKG